MNRQGQTTIQGSFHQGISLDKIEFTKVHKKSNFHPQVVQEEIKQDPNQDMKQSQVVKTDSDQAKSNKDMNNKQVDKDELSKLDLICSMRTKIIIIAVFVLVIGLCLGLGLGFGLKKTRLRPTKAPTIVASSDNQAFGVGNFQLSDGSYLKEQQKFEVMISAALSEHQSEQQNAPKRFLQQQKAIDLDYTVHVTIPEADLTISINSQNQVSVQYDPDKLVDYAISKDVESRRLLLDEISTEPIENQHPTVQQISAQLDKALNQALNTTSMEFKETPMVEFNFDDSTNSFVLRQEDAPKADQTAPKRLLIDAQRIRFLRRWRPNIRPVINQIKPQILPIVANGPLMVASAKEVVKDVKCTKNCTNSGLKIGQNKKLKPKTAIKQCVPRNSRRIRCTAQALKKAETTTLNKVQKPLRNPKIKNNIHKAKGKIQNAVKK